MENALAHMKEPDQLDRQMLEQLASNEKMAELGRLAAGMVHELNTPLSVINSAAQMILRENDLSEFVREMVERIGQETQRLSQFTRGLLSFSRDDRGDAGDVNCSQVLKDVVTLLRYEAQKHSVTIVEDLDYRLPPVTIECNHLKQVYINLLMNALQAMSSGGTLMLRTTLVDDLVETQIGDTGTGILPEDLPRIFDPFYTTKEKGEGTGLGLFITRKIIELYDGRIRVKSAAAQGTTFFITLPCAS